MLQTFRDEIVILRQKESPNGRIIETPLTALFVKISCRNKEKKIA
jgi:hypothetical protein